MIRWLTAWSPSLPRSQWWLTMRWTLPATCILSNKPCCILVATDLLGLFFGNAICCPRFPVASSSSTDMHSCCHSFVASLFENAIGCVFENAVGRDGKCVTHPCFSRGAACLSYQRRWQMLHAILICLVTLWVHFGTRAPPVYPFKEGGSRCMRFGLLLCNTWCTIWLAVLLWRGAYNTNIYTFVQWLERGAFNLLQTFDVFPWFCPFPHHFWCLLTLGVY